MTTSRTSCHFNGPRCDARPGDEYTTTALRCYACGLPVCYSCTSARPWARIVNGVRQPRVTRARVCLRCIAVKDEHDAKPRRVGRTM